MSHKMSMSASLELRQAALTFSVSASGTCIASHCRACPFGFCLVYRLASILATACTQGELITYRKVLRDIYVLHVHVLTFVPKVVCSTVTITVTVLHTILKRFYKLSLQAPTNQHCTPFNPCLVKPVWDPP